ncbi:hypothetical protein [Trinickia fusca]|uniref:hypothetical protein n=1 Tax=Trinickia fusca TaxID=2419777 RepID=UPI0011C3DD23|nr:hypothetical protein [Trinickia fusca]
MTKPLLYLIGFSGLAAGTMIWLSPHDEVVDIERTGYASREACLQDWNEPEDCEFVNADDTAVAASAASGGSDLDITSSRTVATSGWYGPYYTRDGVVYHASGLHTTGVPFQHGMVSTLAVRESALSAGATAFHATPRSVSVSEGHAISRGGFMSSRGGGSGHGSGGG